MHPRSDMDIKKNKVPFGILSLMVLACGATPVDYQSVEELAVAMADAGFECTGELEVYEGTLGHQGCQWPPENHPEFPSDLIDLTVFASDLDRLRFLVSGIAFDCGALPQEPRRFRTLTGRPGLFPLATATRLLRSCRRDS